jgi:hypothetical protein
VAKNRALWRIEVGPLLSHPHLSRRREQLVNATFGLLFKLSHNFMTHLTKSIQPLVSWLDV